MRRSCCRKYSLLSSSILLIIIDFRPNSSKANQFEVEDLFSKDRKEDSGSNDGSDSDFVNMEFVALKEFNRH